MQLVLSLCNHLKFLMRSKFLQIFSILFPPARQNSLTLKCNTCTCTCIWQYNKDLKQTHTPTHTHTTVKSLNAIVIKKISY